MWCLNKEWVAMNLTSSFALSCIEVNTCNILRNKVDNLVNSIARPAALSDSDHVHSLSKMVLELTWQWIFSQVSSKRRAWLRFKIGIIPAWIGTSIPAKVHYLENHRNVHCQRRVEAIRLERTCNSTFFLVLISEIWFAESGCSFQDSRHRWYQLEELGPDKLNQISGISKIFKRFHTWDNIAT